MTYKPSFSKDGPIVSPDKFFEDVHPGQDTSMWSQQKYDFRYLAFPSDLGSEDSGHYMVININVPVNDLPLMGVSDPSGFKNSGLYNMMPHELSKVDRLRLGQFGKYISPLGLRDNFDSFNVKQGSINLFDPGSYINWDMAKTYDGVWASAPTTGRWTRRIAESIALFMPSALVHNTQHAYEDISLTALAGTVASAALSGMATGSGMNSTVATSLAGGIASAGRVSQIAGRPINPMVEILFATTKQKEFIFEFLLAPRNHKESVAIKSIIKTLKFHAAPELTWKGFAFIPPAEFDITFFNKGVENTNIPRINTCVLERVEADYSPTGAYSTFSNGHPVAIRLSLGFRELEIGHKLRVAQGF